MTGSHEHGLLADGRDFDSSPWWADEFSDSWPLSILLAELGAHYGSQPALLPLGAGSAAVTHGTIAERSARIRGALADGDIAPGCTVACMTSHSLSSYEATHAVLTGGHTLVMLEPDESNERNRAVFELAGATQLLVDDRCASAARNVAGRGARVVPLREARRSEPADPVAAEPNAVAALVFTSGSTARPKAVVRTQRDLLHAAYSLSRTYRYVPRDVMLTPGAPGHVGTLNDVLCCLTSGFASIPVNLSRLSLPEVIETTEAHQATVLAMPPSLLRVFLAAVRTGSRALSPRLVIASGEALRRSDVRAFFEALPAATELWQNYGSTETGPIRAGQYSPEDAIGTGGLPLHEPAHGCRVRVVDEAGEDVPSGTVGELVVRSPYLAHGYLGAESSDSSRFRTTDGDREFHIGDRGRLDDAGQLHVLGRGDQQLGLHGRRIEAAAIEGALLEQPGITEAVACVGADRQGEPRLAAIVQFAAGATYDEDALRRALRLLLPPSHVPHRFLRVDAMERTASGKVDRARLLASVATLPPPEPAGLGGAPTGLVENYIADCWQSVLDVARPGREDRFDALGGDSMAAIELAHVLEARIGLRLSPDHFLKLQTIRDQVQVMSAAAPVQDTKSVVLRDDERGPVVVLFPGAGGHAWVYFDLCRYATMPARFHGISYPGVLEPMGRRVSREAVGVALATEVAAIAGTQPVVLGGYSFGGLAALDAARVALQRGVNVQRILLLDPTLGVDRVPIYRLRSKIRMLQEHMRERRDGRRRSKAMQRFEAQVQRSIHDLAVAYRGATAMPPPVATFVLTSGSGGEERSRAVRQVFGESNVSVTDLEHLQILRRPGVEKTAEWLDAALARP